LGGLAEEKTKKLMKNIIILFGCMLAFACQSPKNKITNPADYAAYLNQKSENPKIALMQNELSFWQKKYESDTAQYPYLLKMAAANASLFDITANIENLNTAIAQLEKANQNTNFTMASILRSLAKNYITHHKFREATASLEKADALGENKIATQKMLFDVYMEIGSFDKAKAILDKLAAKIDFDYQIRYAKWLDYKGDTPKAVNQIRLAALMAETDKNEDLRLWSYSNLGDFYGHTGNIAKAYSYYLKTLQLDPNYTYALKGIAWIAFSHEKNTEEAKRIISHLEKIHPSPDYVLMRSQIAEFENNISVSEKLKNEFIAKASADSYGGMYNAYLIKILKNDPKKALKLAEAEIANRPTPVSYELLSTALVLNKNYTKALEIVENSVLNATFEPKSLLGAAQVLNYNNKKAEAQVIKKELLNASFELGPILNAEVKML
jgi:Tfp pilus assembly protein PilF